MIVWRLVQDYNGMIEGSCISEEQFAGLKWFSKAMFEPITDEDRNEMTELKNERYCKDAGIECLLFWSEMEKDMFEDKIINNGIAN